ncbi:MAG TPA: phytoene desaturase family protein [Saprospiraceae bacterium]|nr:phytoene desaturase family protein [Saprospiraceae bacterium]
MDRINVIGSGFSGLAAATVLADRGADVHVFEKNSTPGGRARVFRTDEQFVFDMGPSWYWMPDIFQQYFRRFGKNVSEYYELIRLDPSYRVYFGKDDFLDVPADLSELYNMFESLEKGSSQKLKKFLETAEYKYRVGLSEFVWKPGYSLLEYADWRVLKSLFKLNMLSSVSKEIRTLFHHPRIIQILEFPVLFLGATPQNTPALYSLMNYADLVLGTWYPKGGMYEIVKAMVNLAEEKGVQFHYDEPVHQILTESKRITGIETSKGKYPGDYVIASSDYQHTEQKLLEEKNRTYSSSYWNRRVMAPSSLLYYIGLDCRLDGLIHHNLFFDKDFSQHSEEIYITPRWPKDPLFYICCPSKTDSSVAPEGMENLFILMPIAPGIEDTDDKREKYFNMICERMKTILHLDIRNHLIYKRSYCIEDFVNDYNSYKGNAYGLANTLSQTAFLKPVIRSKKVKNLYFTGQLTAPGPGVPPSLISGQMVAQEIIKTM